MQLPPYDSFLGIEFGPGEPGSSEARLTLGPHHRNKRGVPHGGVISSLLDSALGAAVISSIPAEWWCATTSLSIQFVAGTRGEQLIAHGRVIRRGKSVAHATGEVLGENGKVLATAAGTWHLWPFKPGRKAASGSVPRGYVRLAAGGTLRVGKIVCVGRNYVAHAQEMGAQTAEEPLLFLKPPTALVADGATVHLPQSAGSVHHEVELVAVIGKEGKSIAQEQALEHVLGYGVGLDLTLRDVQSEAKRRGEPWSVSKGFDGSAPVSPIVLRDAVGDGSGLGIELKVNGETRQQGETTDMVHSVARLVAHASNCFSLERGDLLFCGTPAGVGALAPGDSLEATIDRVGRLRIETAAM